MAVNDCKLTGNGCKWVERAGNGQKLLYMAVQCTWLHMPQKGLK